MNGRMRLERVTKRTYRLTGFRQLTTVDETRRFAFRRTVVAIRGELTDAPSMNAEARQLPSSNSPSP